MSTLLANHEALRETVPADALASIRALALQAVEMHGLPGVSHENWKYTGTREIVQGAFVFETTALDTTTSEVAYESVQRFALDCDRLVFINGRLDPKLSNLPSAAPEGCTVLPLDEALEKHPNEVKSAIASEYSVDGVSANGFAALNTAITRNGLFISVDRNVEVAKPLHLVFLSVPGEAVVQSHPRIIIRLDDNARLCLLESHLGLEGAANFLNIASDISVAPGARLEHIRLVEGRSDDRQVNNTRVFVRKDGNYTQHGISLGQRMVRNDLRVTLTEPGAHAELNGLFVAGGNQHIDNHLLVEHMAAHTTSNQVYRGVADDRGRGVFNGKVYVAKDAQKIEANQSSNNLLLAKLAEIDTKPELEIYADDVKCSHGATIGQLDNNMLFYLRSRGIDADTARALLIFAFVDEIVHRIPFAPVRAYLEAELVGRLPDSDVVQAFINADAE